MLEQKLCFTARSDITALSILQDNTLAFSMQLHGIKMFSLQTCSAIKNISIELLSYKTTAVAFHPKEKIVAVVNHHIIYIISTQNKLLLQTIKTGAGIIDLISFAPDSKYLIAGTQSGRVLQYRYDGRAQLSRLCSFGQSHTHHKIKNNYVSTFTFYEKLFACSGYGGVISIFKMNSYTNRYNISASKVRVNALCFLNNKTIVSGNVDGLIQIHSLKKYQAVKNITTPFTNIRHIILMPNPNFILLSGDDKNLALINIKIAKLVSTSYISFSQNVSKIFLTKKQELLIVLENKELLKINLPTVEDLKQHILHNSLDKAYKLLEMNPMLKGTREHKRVEVMYENMYMQAIKALIQTNTKEARKLMKMFSDIPCKSEEVNSIFKAFEYYPRFKTLCYEQKYSLAYSMAEKHPSLKHTHQYKKMEEAFKENFSFAQKQVILGRLDMAKEVLHPYITSLSKKPIITLMLNQNKDFIEFLQAINDKNYVTIARLIKKNALFAEIPTYLTLEKSIQKSLLSIENLIKNTKIDAAIDIIKTLITVPSIQDELKDFYQECKLVKKLQKAYEKNDFVRCYEILDSNHAIDSIELALILEKHWDKLMNECEILALKGDIKNIKNILKDLIRVKTRVDKIGDLLRVSFQTRIKSLLSKQKFKSAENIIYSYIDIFSLDSEMRFLMKTYEKMSSSKLALTNQMQNVSRDDWVHSSLIMGH